MQWAGLDDPGLDLFLFYISLLQLGYYPVAVVILNVNKT